MLTQIFLTLQTPKAQNIRIEGKSNVQLVWICFERCFSRYWTVIFIARLQSVHFLELLCTCCEAFVGVIR